jgi:hypothetical protein
MGERDCRGEGLPPTQRPGREPLLLRRDSNVSKETEFWEHVANQNPLGRSGIYRFGPHIVEVMPGDIRLAKGNPDAVFTAILRISIPTPHPICSPASSYRQLIPRSSAAAAIACPKDLNRR